MVSEKHAYLRFSAHPKCYRRFNYWFSNIKCHVIWEEADIVIIVALLLFFITAALMFVAIKKLFAE